MQNGLGKHAVVIGVVALALYLACLLWRITMTDPEVVKLHLLSLKLVFPGFQGMDALSMIWGAVLSFVYGFIVAVVWHSLHKNCCIEEKKF